MLVSGSSALFRPLALRLSPCLVTAARSLSCSCPRSWKRKSASLRTRPTKIKAKNMRSVAKRWTVLEDERFIRARSNLGHGVMRMLARTRGSLRGYKLAEPEHIKPLKRLLPYYRKLIRRQRVD